MISAVPVHSEVRARRVCSSTVLEACRPGFQSQRMYSTRLQAGFSMVEAGSVRMKNTKNILLKNFLDAAIGAIIWWLWGYALAVCASARPYTSSLDF